MIKKITLVLLVLSAVLFTSCLSDDFFSYDYPSKPYACIPNFGKRSIYTGTVFDFPIYISEENLVKEKKNYELYVVKDYVYKDKVLFQLGRINIDDITKDGVTYNNLSYGFIINGTGTKGKETAIDVEGVKLIWFFSDEMNDGYIKKEYEVVVKPDGTCLYYDFKNAVGDTVTPDVYYAEKVYPVD